MTKETRGRPKGYSPGNSRITTHKIGEWEWNTETLHKRIQKGEPDQCWAWTGSKNAMGNIFGAFKNNKAQMTQANRLLQMEILNEPIDGNAVKMKCNNKHCSNPAHFNLVVSKAPRKNINPTIARVLNESAERWQPEPVETPQPKTREITHKLSISEQRYADLPVETRMALRELARDYAAGAGINWEFEYRWMTMTQENLMLARIKYAQDIEHLTVTRL